MVNIRKISKRTLIKQNLSIIKEKVKLYTYIMLMLILNKAKLNTLPLIY
jgi:hypothetical protein